MADSKFVICSPCESNGESIQAAKFCVICDEALCKVCANCHKSFKQTKSHNLINCSSRDASSYKAAKLLSSYMICPDHEDRSVEVLCEDHGILCCLTCFILSHNTCKRYSEIKTIAAGCTENGQTDQFRAHLEKISFCMKEIIDTNSFRRKDFEKSKDEVFEQLKQIKSQLINLYERIESSVINKVENIRRDEDIASRILEEIWKQKLDTNEDQLKLLDSVIEIGTDAQIFVAIHKLKETLVETEKALSDQGSLIIGHKPNLKRQDELDIILQANVDSLIAVQLSAERHQLPLTLDYTERRRDVARDREINLSSDVVDSAKTEEANTSRSVDKNNIADAVMKKKHKLEGEELTVQVCIEELCMCQGNGSEPKIKIPDNITIDNIEEKIVDFMKMNDSCKEVVNKQLEDCYAKVVWPEKGTFITIECEITEKTPEFRKLVKDWKINVERIFMDYVNLLSCKEHPVWDEGWDDVLKGLREIGIDNPDAVAVFVDKKEKKIRVVGYKHVAESVSKSVDKVIKNVCDEIEMRKQTVKQTISNLKPLQLRMLLASKYPNKMEDKFQKLKVKINQNKNELIYEGVRPDIQAAKVDLYEQINSYSMRVLVNIPQNCIDLFHSEQVKDYIVKKLESQKLVGVWEATDNELVICSYESSVSSCMKFINESVQEKVIPVNRELSYKVTSQQWINRITEIHKQNPGVCKINCNEDFTKVYVTAKDDLVDEIHILVTKFLKNPLYRGLLEMFRP